MAAPERPSERANGDRPELVTFPNALRNDNLADTYVDGAGNMWLVPTVPHDFDFSARLQQENLSSGQVTELFGREAIRFPEDADLITLPSIMNAAMAAPQARADVTHALELLGDTSRAMYARLGSLPQLDIYGVAVDRTRDRVELIVPYKVDPAQTPVDVFYLLERNAYAHARSANEVSLIRDCFRGAYAHFTGDVQ